MARAQGPHLGKLNYGIQAAGVVIKMYFVDLAVVGGNGKGADNAQDGDYD
jgi:hypothetical protein